MGLISARIKIFPGSFLGLDNLSEVIGRFIFFLIIAFFPVSASLANMLDIKSDNISVDRANNIMEFNGNVRLSFEELFLTTDQIIVLLQNNASKQTQQTMIKKINIPHKVTAITTNGEKIIIADRALFDAKRSVIIFEGNVLAKDKDNILLADKLEIHATPRF